MESEGTNKDIFENSLYGRESDVLCGSPSPRQHQFVRKSANEPIKMSSPYSEVMVINQLQSKTKGKRASQGSKQDLTQIMGGIDKAQMQVGGSFQIKSQTGGRNRWGSTPCNDDLIFGENP